MPAPVARESLTRLFVKSATWRVSGAILLAFLTWLAGGGWKLGLEVGVAYNTIRLVTYMIHDVFWNRVTWGRN